MGWWAWQNHLAPKLPQAVATPIRALFDRAGEGDAAGDFLGLTAIAVMLLSTIFCVPLMLNMAPVFDWFFPLQAPLAGLSNVPMLQAAYYLDVFFVAWLFASIPWETKQILLWN